MAPTFKVESMVKGEAPDLSSGLHVVEFWATWCGPCKMNIPHLTEMAHKYKGKVDVTGVDVSESGPDKLAKVKAFVADMGEKMDYNIAYDGDTKAMDSGFMKAANQRGIPTAFLVKDGQIIDIEVGYPMPGLEKAIDEVLAGKFDVAKAKADYDKRTAEEAEYERKQAEQMKALQPAMTAMRAKKYDEEMSALAKVQTTDPMMKMQVASMRFDALVRSGSPKVMDEAKTILAGPTGKQAMMLNSYAWSIVDPAAKVPNPDYAAALMLAKAAAEASAMKDPDILDTYAVALFKTSHTSEAIDVETKAIELKKAAKEADPATLKEMQGRLDEFKTAKG